MRLRCVVESLACARLSAFRAHPRARSLIVAELGKTTPLRYLMKTSALTLCVGLALAGCATPYQHSSNWGGFDETAGPGKMHSINFNGNMFISNERAQQFVLYRAAEVTLQKKKTHFILYEGLEEAATGRATALPRTVRIHNGAAVSSFVLPIDGAQGRAFDARVVINQLQEQTNPQSASLQFSAIASPPPVAQDMVNIQVTGRGKNRVCQDNKWVMQTPVEVGAAHFIQVPAGRRVSLQRLFSLTYGSCQPALSFIPTAGHSYAFNVSVAGPNEQYAFCAIELVRVDGEAPAGVRLEPTVGAKECH
jgi:hypothetical protein